MLNMLFAALWIIVGFLALRFAGQAVFHEKFRADIAAIAIVLAFAIGASLRPFPFGSETAPLATTACYIPDEISGERTPSAEPATGGNYSGNIDSLSAGPDEPSALSFQDGCNIYANGWAADMSTKTPVSGIVFVIDSKRVINATSMYGAPRPDVVKAFGAAALLRTGFSHAVIPTRGIAAGPHTIQLGGLSSDGKAYHLIGAPTAITLR